MKKNDLLFILKKLPEVPSFVFNEISKKVLKETIKDIIEEKTRADFEEALFSNIEIAFTYTTDVYEFLKTTGGDFEEAINEGLTTDVQFASYFLEKEIYDLIYEILKKEKRKKND